jgi:hypothetical protein
MEVRHGRVSRSVFDSVRGEKRASLYKEKAIEWIETRESEKEK